MADVVVDASVVAKWYIPEQDHEVARALRDDYLNGRHDLFAPTLLPYEVINALKYSGHYEGDRLVEASSTIIEYGIELVGYAEVGPVATVANELAITLYDAAYLALADTTEGTVYTADSQLLDAAAESSYADVSSHIRDYTPQ